MRIVASGRLGGVHVIVVNNFTGPGLGGGEVQLLPVLAALLAEDAAVSVLAPAGSGLLSRARDLGAIGVEVALRPRGLPAALAAISGQARATPAGERAIVVGTGYFTNLLARLVAPRCSALAVNIVGVVPGASVLDGGSGFAARLRAVIDRATAQRVDAVVVVSRAVEDAVITAGFATAHVHLVENGVDLNDLRSCAAQSLPPGTPESRPLVVCVARLEKVKGVEYLVRAVAHTPEVTVAIVGEGSEIARLRAIAAASGVDERVHFLGGSGAAALMAVADVVVVPSLSEAFGLVAAEASALARPVVASRVGGLSDVVEDGVSGLLVPPADPLALAAAISELLADPERANAFGRAGRARVEDRFTSERMAEAYVALLADLVATPLR